MKKGRATGLGRGIGELLGQAKFGIDSDFEQKIIELDINDVKADKDQPRRRFSDESIQELAASIKEFGILQPIIVQKNDDLYTIIAGERRYRAAKLAELEKVPAIIKDLKKQEILEIALIENIQREDLSPIDEALAYKTLNEEFNLSQDIISKKVGKSRSYISSIMRLLNFDDEILALLEQNSLSIGHLKTIMSIENKSDQLSLAQKMAENNLSVREAEELVRNFLNKPKEGKKPIETQPRLEQLSLLEQRLNAKISLKSKGDKGKIEIKFNSIEERDKILGLMLL